MPQSTEAIEVSCLVKRFGPLVAINGVSITVHPGEVFGILGPNGAGKTTALECLEGLQPATSGSIRVLGLDVKTQSKQIKDRIGMQLQASAYFDYLTLRETLDLFGQFYSNRIVPRILLERVGLLEKERTTIAKLSGGERQRFSIAAALVNKGEILFLDEPTASLDPQGRHDIWALIQELHNEGRTIVLTTHYMEEAQLLCDRVAIMDRGEIVALGTPPYLIHTLPAPYELNVTFTADVKPIDVDHLEGILDISVEQSRRLSVRATNASMAISSLLDWTKKKEIGLEHVEIRPATLEDVFLSVTGRRLSSRP